jgi:hypothetical protein
MKYGRTNILSPVRNPKSLFTDTFTGTVNLTRGNKAAVQFESLLEQDWLILTDAYQRDLVLVRHQPMKLRFWDSGKYRTWTPDFLIERKRRTSALVEVKPLEKIYPAHQDANVQARLRMEVRDHFELLRQQAQARGYDFELATENEIRVEPSLQNASLMRRCSPGRIPETWCKIARAAALQLPRRSCVSAFEEVLPKGIDAFSVALYLAWAGEVALDPSSKWSRRSLCVRGSAWIDPSQDEDASN